jgi:3-deoxy-D-manno-octulosonate 8-phosphate phosphatase (KDO 8-P phosphatase)
VSVDTLTDRARDVRLLVLDVDGVLTDGRLYFSARGEELKVFHVRDGAGIVQLLKSGVQVAVISGRDSRAVEKRAAELGITWLRQGVSDKLSVLNDLLAMLNLGPQAVACVGDDSPDIPLLNAARLAIAVADAHPDVRSRAHYVTASPGGRGAVREVCDLIVKSQVAS